MWSHVVFKKLQGWLERILVWQSGNLGLIFIFLVTSCVILGKAHNNSEPPVACLSNKIKTNLCLSHTHSEMRGRGSRDITQDIAKFKGPTEHYEAIIKNKLPEARSLRYKSCFAKRGNCPKALEVKNCICCCPVALSCNSSLFLPSTSSPSPVMVPPQRQTHWARMNY